MSELTKSKYSDNEITKAVDFNYAEDREIKNISSVFEQLAKSTNDPIVYGLEVQERSAPSMNVDIKIGLGFRVAGAEAVYNGSLMGPIAIVNGGAQNRIDTLEIRAKETDFDTQQRAFKDPGTGQISYQDVEIKTRYEIEAQVVQGTESAGVAPNHTAGWMKVAEIHVDAGESTAIYNADIENVTAGKDGEANSAWTAETTATFRLKSLSEIKSLFRTKHKEDGDHGDDVIQDVHINFGIGAGQVDADLMPLGTAITHAPTGGTPANLTSGSLVRAAVQKILDLLIGLAGVENDAVDDRHMNWGIVAGQIDADLMPLGTVITHAPTGGTAAGLTATSTVRYAVQRILDLLINLSGVQNDAIVNRHIGPAAVRQTEIDFGVDAGDVDADVIPLGTIVSSSPTGGTPTNLATTSFVRAAIQEAFNRLIDLSGVQNGAALARHLATNSVETVKIKARNVTFPKMVTGALDTYFKAQGAGVDPIYEKLTLRDTGVKIGNSTRNAAGAQVITGVGFRPSVVLFITGDFDFANLNASWGFDDGTVHHNLRLTNDGAQQIVQDLYSLNITRDVSNHIRGYITTLGADGFTITWTLLGNCQCSFFYLALP